MSRTKGRRTKPYTLVSSIQISLRKACLDTKIFSSLPQGSNPWTREADALTTALISIFTAAAVRKGSPVSERFEVEYTYTSECQF